MESIGKVIIELGSVTDFERNRYVAGIGSDWNWCQPPFIRNKIKSKVIHMSFKYGSATDDPDAPWRNGVYDVEIPDHPHVGGNSYPESTYARTWFRIGHDGARYLHTGVFSAGCMTVTERTRWDEIYVKLIKARKGDGRSVGTLEVVD